MVSLYSWAGFLAFIIPALKMYAVQQYAMLDNVFDLWGFAACGVLIILYMNNSKNIAVPKGLKYIFAFICVMMLATVMNFSDQLTALLSETSRLLITPLYLMLAFSSGEEVFLSALKKLRVTYITVLLADVTVLALELLGVKIYKSVIYTILGMDNYAAFMIIPMLTVIFYASCRNNGRIDFLDIAIYALCLAAKVITFSFAAMLGLVAMGLVILFAYNIKSSIKILLPQLMIGLSVLLIIGVVAMQASTRLDIMLEGTDKTITSRSMIWEHTVEHIPDKLFLGHGKTSGSQFKSSAGLSLQWHDQATHPHNFILAVLYSTGLVGALIYAGILSQLLKKIRMKINDRITSVVLGGIIGYFILMIADDYVTIPMLYTLLTVVYLDNNDMLGKVKMRKNQVNSR
ncbi:MAG: O-antigen ligase family protein [Oscillospiraceae bacterium]|nr:O-antigen ligase family protein [Oscillospiraceae bacterium]